MNLTGQRFGRVVALHRGEPQVFPSGQKHTTWVVVCDCGQTKTILTANLRRGLATSCGCYQMELRIATGRRNRRRVISYSGAHRRIRREKGRAHENACLCGEPATTWSYDHQDPTELAEPFTTSAGSEITLYYSLDPDHYVARCKSCHSLFDRATKRARCAA